MHRLLSAAILGIAFLSAPVSAQFTNGDNTVEQALQARSDTPVVLVGYIIESLGDEYYTFEDDTGTIRVEIERRTFRGVEVTPETRVRLTGEVERSVRGRYIDVNRLEVVVVDAPAETAG